MYVFSAETRAREEQKAERKASFEGARKASWESTRKASMESMESMESMNSARKQSYDELDIEQIKASVDDTKLDVKSAAQKFAEMDRKAEQERKEAQRKSEMAVRIQSHVRGKLAREAYTLRAGVAERIALRMQTQFRRRQAQKLTQQLRERLEREQASAVVIQKIIRGKAQQQRYQSEIAIRKAAAIFLQSVVRARQAQAAYTKQIEAAYEIQRFAARMLAGQRARLEAVCIREEHAAATTIQSVFRARAARSQAHAKLEAIIRLQSIWRRSLAVTEVSRLKAEAEVEAFAREELECSMATKIQSHWRGSAARSEVADLLAEAAVKEQARQAEVEAAMATKIQSHWRGSAARSEVADIRAEAVAEEQA
ncbi:hypothetical protein BBJ28_00016611, partial [Nothophytophthora sp. Chile5]